jgi:glucose/arabinose dehydrogenase
MLLLRLTLALASSTLLLAGCASGETDGTPPSTPAEAGATLALEEVVSGLDAPLFAAAAPGEPNRLYVVEREGRIRVVEDGRLLDDPFLDIVELVTSGGEQGLLSVAFHPAYADNGLFYVDYTDLAGDTRVVEYRARRGEKPEQVRELLFVDQPYANHNGGQLQFGPDGLLYVGMGDGGAGGDPENRAQDLGDKLGKLLRLDVDRSGATWEVVAYGLRNPWRFSYDRETGDLYVGDVGQGAWEEIDFLAAGGGLVNFGWDAFEGNHAYEDKQPNTAGRLSFPLVEYPHEEGCSVTGGYVYRGDDVPEAEGRYFYGDYCKGTVWSVEVNDGEASRPRREPFTVDSLSSFGEDSRGELYLVSLDGVVYRLVAR